MVAKKCAIVIHMLQYNTVLQQICNTILTALYYNTMTPLHTAIHATLALTDLHPSNHVNAVLHELVTQVINSQGDIADIAPNTVAKVQDICARAEGELESYWSERIATTAIPHQVVKEFPYWDNYAQLARHEVGLLKQSGLALENVKRMLIIGSGPLPLSAVHFARHLPSTALIDHIDNNPHAVRSGEALLRALGYNGHYMCVDGASGGLTERYDVVLVAALAGSALSDKQAITDAVLPNVSDGGRLLMRSARGIRGLLYPVFAATELSGATLLAEHHPEDDTINSVFIYGKEPS
jgi:nicotianamine synthase